MNLKDLQEKLQGLLTQSEAIRMKYQGSRENMTGQEEEEWTRILEDADKTRKQIKNLQAENEIREWSKGVDESRQLPLPGASNKDLGGPGAAPGGIQPGMNDAARKAWQKFLKGGPNSLGQGDLQAIAGATSTKAYQADDPAGGGFLIAPQQFVAELITLVKNLLWMRQLATTYTLTRAESLGIPAMDTDPSDSDWTSELAVGGTESTMAFGKRELRPHPVAKLVKISNKLIRTSAISVEATVQDRLAYKMAVTQEKAFIVGTGADQPLGVYTASSMGISTNRDTTAANATSITGDDVINVHYKLKPQYRNVARWILGRTVVQAVRKLKDSNNNYLWQPGLNSYVAQGTALIGAQPEMLMGHPIMESEYAPSTITSGLYTMLLGDFSKYVICDALDMQLQVLDQLYAANNQTGYILRSETDGMPVLEEAFSRLVQA